MATNGRQSQNNLLEGTFSLTKNRQLDKEPFLLNNSTLPAQDQQVSRRKK
jgi:hypothetical protein